MRVFASTSALLACLAACGLPPANSPAADERGANSLAATHSTTPSGELALYEALEARSAPGSNIVFSPFSITQAFGLAHLGARGDTARQIETAFQLASGDEAAPRLSQQRTAVLDSGEGVRIRVANALWLSRAWRFRPAFVEAARQHHGASVASLDYRGARRQAAATINQWARTETEGLVPEIVGVEDIDPDTAAFLTNALFFDGRWTEPFDESETRPFLIADGSSKPFPFMKHVAEYATAEHDGWRAIRLPYGSTGRFVMDVMLPAVSGTQLPSMARAPIDPLTKQLASTSRQRLRLFLPRFEIDFRKDVLGSLEATGLTLPFDKGRADFSGMIEPGQPRLYIDRVFHAAKLQVFAEGTRAAAVTAMVPRPVSAPPPWNGPDFRVDQPFLFAIRDTRSGALLFLGRVNDPHPLTMPAAR